MVNTFNNTNHYHHDSDDENIPNLTLIGFGVVFGVTLLIAAGLQFKKYLQEIQNGVGRDRHFFANPNEIPMQEGQNNQMPRPNPNNPAGGFDLGHDDERAL